MRVTPRLLGSAGLLIALVVSAAGCGLRAEVPAASPRPSAAPGATTSKPATTVAAAVTTTTDDATDETTSTTSVATTTTTAGPAAFDLVAYCDAAAKVNLTDMSDLVIFTQVEADDLVDRFKAVVARGPAELAEDQTKMLEFFEYEQSLIRSGEIKDRDTFQAFMAKQLDTMAPGLTAWVVGQQKTLAWNAANCPA